MTQYNNENRFVLFPNKRKETEKHPDLTGSIHIGNQEHFFDAWITWDGPDISRINGKIGQAKTGGKGGGKASSAPRQRRELSENMPQRQSKPQTDDFDDIPW